MSKHTCTAWKDNGCKQCKKLRQESHKEIKRRIRIFLGKSYGK